MNASLNAVIYNILQRFGLDKNRVRQGTPSVRLTKYAISKSFIDSNGGYIDNYILFLIEKDKMVILYVYYTYEDIV